MFICQWSTVLNQYHSCLQFSHYWRKWTKTHSYANKGHLTGEAERVGYSQISEGPLNCLKKSHAHSQMPRLYADKIVDRGMATEVDSIMAPRRFHALMPGTCKYVTFCGKRDFCGCASGFWDGMSTLDWPVGQMVIIRLLIKGRSKRAKVGDPGKGSAASFEGWRKSHEPRNACASRERL